ncbi:hypothetical protein AGMMS50268_26250 [Spirochaetia bacterium]|nr:hypothetical protein AGMMS50268_26250 [Spirochaetia bacterium]
MGLLTKAATNKASPGITSLVPGAFIPSPKKGLGLLKRGQKKRDLLQSSGYDIRQKVEKWYGSSIPIQGIVLDLPALPGDEEFSVRVNRMVTSLGIAMALPSRRCLVIFPNTVDRELLAHRLCRSLKTAAPSVFVADNVQALPNMIRPFL